MRFFGKVVFREERLECMADGVPKREKFQPPPAQRIAVTGFARNVHLSGVHRWMYK
jgi:hypothetical protein